MQSILAKPGWKTWRFEQIAKSVNERVEPGDVDEDHYVGLEHLDSDSLKIRRWGTPNDVEATKLRFKKGDIIFGRRRVYQRKLAVAEFDGICSAHAMVLRPKTDVVLPEFLPFFMQSDLFMNRALEISVGSLSPTINWKTLAKQEFALPPLEEQRRIAKLLKASMYAIEAIQNAEESLDKLYDAFLDHSLSQAQTSGSICNIDELCTEITVGIVVNPSKYYADTGVLAISHSNVMRGEIDTSKVDFFSYDAHEQLKKTWLFAGNIVLPRVSTLAGRPYYAAVVPKELDKINSIGVVILRPDATKVNPLFLEACLNAPATRRRLIGASVGSIQRQLNIGIIKKEKVPIAPMEMQESIALTSVKFKSDLKMANRRLQQQIRVNEALREKLIGSEL